MELGKIHIPSLIQNVQESTVNIQDTDMKPKKLSIKFKIKT